MAQSGRSVRVAVVVAGLLGCLGGSTVHLQPHVHLHPSPSLHVHAQAPAGVLPPLVYVCPMHADQQSDEKGECPICGMDLEPMRLDTVYTCPIHAVVAEHEPGKCPICSRTLGEVTVAVAWRCPGSDEELIEPRQCTDGTTAVRVQKALAHGNHNPQHGGQFFMAADSWHHIEGVYPTAGVFRLYLFDDYTKPLADDRIAAVKARVVTREETNPQTFETKEVTSAPLVKSPDGPYLEADIESLPLPASLVVQASFTEGSKEQRFDFTFTDFSVDSAPPAMDVATRLMMNVPDDPAAIVEMLAERRETLREVVGRGGLSEVWVPALQGKELALALEMYAREFPATRRAAVAAAAREIVQAAFRLDASGDRGEREAVQRAAEQFEKAVSVLEAAFGGMR